MGRLNGGRFEERGGQVRVVCDCGRLCGPRRRATSPLPYAWGQSHLDRCFCRKSLPAKARHHGADALNLVSVGAAALAVVGGLGAAISVGLGGLLVSKGIEHLGRLLRPDPEPKPGLGTA